MIRPTNTSAARVKRASIIEDSARKKAFPSELPSHDFGDRYGSSGFSGETPQTIMVVETAYPWPHPRISETIKSVTSNEMSSEPKQPMRLLKNKNI